MQKENIKKNRTFVLGDVHGGYKALLQCFERSGFDPEVDTLISLGDIADGWSQVPECVELLLTCKNLIAIKGNHDEWCENWMQNRASAPLSWLSQGGKATYNAYVKAPDLINKHYEQFFRKQHLFYKDEENRVFVHGGYVSHEGVGHDAVHYSYYWDRELWSIALSGEAAQRGKAPLSNKLPRRLRPHKEIFIGHTSTVNWNTDKPMKACNVWNLDTGGGFYGKITIMDVDTKEYWQSDLVKDLYPNEKGR